MEAAAAAGGEEAVGDRGCLPPEHLKGEWALSTDILLKNMSEELSERHQIELNEMGKNLQVEAEETKQNLKNLSLEKDQAEICLKNLENLYHLSMKKLQTEHEQQLQDVREQSKKQEGMLQQEIEELKARLEEIKMESGEIKYLGSQVDSAQTGWQELSELKEQLLAHTSHMEEMECLKKDYQIKWDKKRTEHENELEQLRLYFEQKLKIVEENYREELTMLHQRLQEVKDSFLLENTQDQHVELGPSTSLSEEMTEKGRCDLFEHLTQQLEHYKVEDKTQYLEGNGEGASAQLKNLQQEEVKENRGGEVPTAILRSGIEICIDDSAKLKESYQQMLKLLLIMVKATQDTEDLIYKKTGLCLNHCLASGTSRETQIMTEEQLLTDKSTTMDKLWIKKSDRIDQGKFLDQTLPEHSFASLKANEISDLSEHLCESLFENQDLVFEHEEQIHQLCHGLHTAVQILLDHLAETTKQVEEIKTTNINIGEEFKGRNWRVCHIVNDHRELMECFSEESKVNSQLVLELHKTKGLVGGCLAEIHALEETLKLKEKSECHLVLELEGFKAQVQELTQELARSAEEQKLLTNQNKALTANIGEREAELIKKIEYLTKAKLEVECQAEKNNSTLNAHMKMLEIELEDQLNKNQNLAAMSLEVADLRQQMQALERQLKHQRDFMDKQAAEREQERDEFQEEIQKLELELNVTAKFKASEYSKANLVEFLQKEIKERTEDFNRLFLEQEHIQKELVARNDQIENLKAQIRELECRNDEQTNNINKLTQQLKKMKEMEAKLKQDKETLQQEKYNNLIQISALNTKLDEARQRIPIGGSQDRALNEQSNAEEEMSTKESKIADLLQQIGQFKEMLVNKNEELFQLSSELQLEKNVNIQLKEENAQLKENIEKLAMQNQNPDDKELVIFQFLMSLLEEKNEETDHLNEQILRLEHTIENREEKEDIKSVIEHLHGDKEQLLRDKAHEIKQLNKMIEKLQEFGFLVLMCHKADDRQCTLNRCNVLQMEENILNETKKGSLLNRDEKDCMSLIPSKKQLQGQLEITITDRETLQQLLEEEKYQFKTEVKILGQNLQNVQRSFTEHFIKVKGLQLQYDDFQQEEEQRKRWFTYKKAELRCSETGRPSSGHSSAHVQELEDHLQERERVLSEKEQQLQRVSEQKAVVQHVKENVQPENDICILTETLHDKEAIYQRQITELQLIIGELKSQVEKKEEELEALRSENDLSYSQLKSYMEKGQDETKFLKEKNMTLTELKMSGKDHNIQNKHLQSILFIQEEKITKEQQEQQLVFQEIWKLNHPPQNTQLIQKMPDSFQNIVMDGTPWDSPEILRKENSMEHWSNLPSTPFSEIDSLHSMDSESLCSEPLVVPEGILGFVESPASYCDSNEETAVSFIVQSSTAPGPIFSISGYSDVQENISVRNAEDLTLMPHTMQDDLRSNNSEPENANNEYVSKNNSDLAYQLKEEKEENTKTALLPDESGMAYLHEMVPDICETALKEKDFFSQQLKNVLDMIYEESHKILVLSEKSLPTDDKKAIQKTLSVEGWQREKLILLDSIQSLKDYLIKVPHKEDRENVSALFGWSGELLRVVQCVLEKDHNMLENYLQSHNHSPGSGDEASLVEKLQHIMEHQEQQQKIVLEHLLSSDRKTLLTEIQDLDAQLRLMHLESQEKLQQLQEMLINTENKGIKQEHQLRRQVELLEYKLQQEKSITSDLQASLKVEQEKASEMHELLKQEGTVIFNLKSDLCKSRQANERLQKSLQELQKELVKYSSVLENKEMAMTAILQDLENEKCKKKELQSILDEQQHQHKISENEKSEAIEELQAALELQCIQNSQLSVALEHEQSANSNLRKELQIEHSRCTALLSQEQSKLLELQKNIEVEKNCNLELLSALNHERVLTEQLSMKINECAVCAHKESLQDLQAQLYRERAHARELLATVEKTWQEVLDSKQVGEKQVYFEDFQKNQELHVSQGLQNKEQNIQHALEIQKKKETQMKKEWEQLQSDLRLLRNQEKSTEQTIRGGRHKQNTALGKSKELKDDQTDQRGFEMQLWQNTGKIKALQQMIKDMKEHKKLFNYKNQYKSPPNSYAIVSSTTDTISLHEEEKRLQNLREQLFSTAACLSEFVYKIVDNIVNWPASRDEIISTLLNILELEAQLSTSFKSVGGKPELQNCIKPTDHEATKHNLIMENTPAVATCNLKMQKLYRKYLRAESFRKALVYQKKYLLLLLGGFQECEQATLSLIARMGIYPSPPDLIVAESRSHFFIKFRSAVRVITAISRLRFLVKKWQKVSSKRLPSEAISPTTGQSTYPRNRVQALKQPLAVDATKEAEYCNINDFTGLMNRSPQSSYFFHDRSTSSAFQVSSKDPEQSITDYVAHLEAIQQKLGILMLGQAPQRESL